MSRGRSRLLLQLALAVFTLFVGVFALGELHYLLLGRTAEARVLGVEEKYRGVGAKRTSFLVRYAFEDQRGQTQTATSWFGPSWRGGVGSTVTIEWCDQPFFRSRSVDQRERWFIAAFVIAVGTQLGSVILQLLLGKPMSLSASR